MNLWLLGRKRKKKKKTNLQNENINCFFNKNNEFFNNNFMVI